LTIYDQMLVREHEKRDNVHRIKSQNNDASNRLACVSYQVAIDRGLLLTTKFQNQGFLVIKLKTNVIIIQSKVHTSQA
jgi:hypothetical protein